MRPIEPRSFDRGDRMLDPCDEPQVQAWAAFYQTTPDAIRQACDALGVNRTDVELKLAAPRHDRSGARVSSAGAVWVIA